MAQLALNGTIQIPLSVNFVTFTTSSSSSTSYTFSGISIKQPGLIVIGVHARKNDTGFSNLSSVTVNGVSATIIESVRQVANSIGVRSSLVAIRINTGTTADIVLTYSAPQTAAAISVYNIQGNLSDTPVGSANSSSTDANNVLDLNLLTSENIQVGIGICSNLGQLPSWFSTQLGALPTLYADGFGSGTFRITGSLYKRGSATGTTALQCATIDTNRPSVLVAAVWR